MKIITDTRDDITCNSVCAVGSFDGVHRGHQHIIHYLKQIAAPGQHVGIVTFMPLPFFVLTSAPIMYLSLKEEKESILADLGIEFVYYFKFTKEFSRFTARAFTERLVADIGPGHVVVGENFHFGKGRQGSADMLRHLAEGKFQVHILPRVKEDGTISSTRIRELLLLGHIRAANELLGRAYTVSGRVIKGKGKGARLGFPTVNVTPDPQKLLPLDGVYCVRVLFSGKEFQGALFCRHDILEVHILDFAGDLYDQMIAINFMVRIRGLERFSTDDQLRAAIAEDIRVIKEMDNR